jgi:hypothetical protein
VLVRTDGQDGLNELEAAPVVPRAPRLTDAERVAAARREHPDASLRKLATLTGLSKSSVDRILKAPA